MGGKMIERLARLERELAEQETVYRIVEAPWLAAMSEHANAAQEPAPGLDPEPGEDAPPPAPKPAREPEPGEDAWPCVRA